ncbi:MAG: NAD(+) synthase, partial [Clostridia bacterium]|nr:NAD(+) synthase [Clostridia bacterium]
TSRRNYDEDTADAKEFAARYNIEIRNVDLTPIKEAELKALDGVTTLNAAALANIAPRLRMLTLYAIAAAENRLVAGTGNRSEAYVGYFTKWGDGAHDFNPIADLTVTEIYEFLRYLDAPKCVIEKAPSAALFDGQTDETEMGVTYAELDSYLSGGDIPADKKEIVERMHRTSEHKRKGIAVYEE